MAFVWSLCRLSPPILLPMALARPCCSGCTAETLLADASCSSVPTNTEQ